MRENTILLVEDEKKLMRTVSDYFKMNGYQVLTAEDGVEAVDTFMDNMNKIDLVLLDIMLPKMNGNQVLKEIRKYSTVPTIMLTAKSSVDDQVYGFECGADDYITKPFTFAILKVHVEAVLKRTGKLGNDVSYGNLRIDIASQRVYSKDEYIETTPKEYEVLLYFIENANVVMTRETILVSIWGIDYKGDNRTVDTIVKQLRKKLPENCQYIQSVYGVGYVFREK